MDTITSPSFRNPGALLKQLGLSPRKQLGQHFLADQQVAQKIIDAAELRPDDQVLEVGPGLGALTYLLADRCAWLMAVERDARLAEHLKNAFQGRPNVSIVYGDILAFDPCSQFRQRGYVVIADLPYAITSPTLRHFLENPCQPLRMVVTVQQEVAQRITATPGAMSLLAVSVQTFGHPQLLAVVPASAFHPRPKVASAILRIDLYDRPTVAFDLDCFFRTVRAGFSQPRKQLHNSLAAALDLKPSQVERQLAAICIDPTRRAESLSLAEWEAVSQAFTETECSDTLPRPS
ncbi:MAG: ribosomal RNA small subunit methyltransferase A [Chloroflexi bacterium]|nr:ribosomal RNA small subunit methyltransferase A [Chloroflexota bacterium]